MGRQGVESLRGGVRPPPPPHLPPKSAPALTWDRFKFSKTRSVLTLTCRNEISLNRFRIDLKSFTIWSLVIFNEFKISPNSFYSIWKVFDTKNDLSQFLSMRVELFILRKRMRMVNIILSLIWKKTDTTHLSQVCKRPEQGVASIQCTQHYETRFEVLQKHVRVGLKKNT